MTVIPKENSYINTHTHTHDSLTEDLLVIFLMGKKRKGKDSNWLFIFLTLRVRVWTFISGSIQWPQGKVDIQALHLS